MKTWSLYDSSRFVFATICEGDDGQRWVQFQSRDGYDNTAILSHDQVMEVAEQLKCVARGEPCDQEVERLTRYRKGVGGLGRSNA